MANGSQRSTFPKVLRVCSAWFACALLLGAAPASGATAQTTVPTFSRNVAPILYAHCASCHRPAEIGGFSLLTYADVRPRAAAIARATRERRMPPWKPAPIDGLTLVGERRLTDRDIDTIQRWLDGGAVEGSPSELPASPRFPEGWRLGTPDLIVTMPKPYTVAPGGSDQLRNVVIPVALARDRFVRGLEFRPENPRVVHHANIRVDRTRSARALDGVDGAPGFDGRLTGGADFPDGHFLGWTPGQLPPLSDETTAWRLDAGSDLVVQLHLRPTTQSETVQVRIGLFFGDEPAAIHATRAPVMLRLGKQDLDIPAGLSDYRVADAYRLPVDVDLVAVQPHAHVRAREVTASAVLPHGGERLLLHVPDWDFDWQDQYRFAAPVPLPAGTLLRIGYRYDNSASNRRNPDRPPRRIRWGQHSHDEMGDVWFQVIVRHDRDRARLVQDIGRKVLTEDGVGYETMLEDEPSNPRLHEAAASIFVSLGEHARGIRHLETALRLDPRSQEAHYNLAIALAQLRRTDEAIAHLREALALAPEHARAHTNLGALLRMTGNIRDASTHLERALALDPRNGVAHTHLGAVRLARGDVTGAITEYRAALDANSTLLEPLTELAWTLATSPTASIRHESEAVALAERARDLTQGSDVRVLDALAAAYASIGRYADAVRVMEEAIDLIPEGIITAAESRRLLERRSAQYQRHEPYRDETRR